MGRNVTEVPWASIGCCFTFGSGSGSGFNEVIGSRPGFRSRMAKMMHKSRKKFRNCTFWNNFFSAVFFSSYFWASGSVFILKCWIRIRNQWIRIRNIRCNDGGLRWSHSYDPKYTFQRSSILRVWARHIPPVHHIQFTYLYRKVLAYKPQR